MGNHICYSEDDAVVGLRGSRRPGHACTVCLPPLQLRARKPHHSMSSRRCCPERHAVEDCFEYVACDTMYYSERARPAFGDGSPCSAFGWRKSRPLRSCHLLRGEIVGCKCGDEMGAIFIRVDLVFPSLPPPPPLYPSSPYYFHFPTLPHLSFFAFHCLILIFFRLELCLF